MEITPDMKVGKLAFTLWGRPAFDGFVAARYPGGVEAWAMGEYRRGVDEHLLAAEGAMRELERLDEWLSDLIVAPPLSAGKQGYWRDDGAADAVKTEEAFAPLGAVRVLLFEPLIVPRIPT